MFSSASSISGLTIASTSSFHGPGQTRASNSSAPPLESLSRFTPLTVNQAYAQRVPKHRSLTKIPRRTSASNLQSERRVKVVACRSAFGNERLLGPNPRIGEFLSRKPASTTYCFNANVRYATRRSRPHVKTRSIARPNVGYEHFVMKEEEHHEERSGSDRRDKDSRKARHN